MIILCVDVKTTERRQCSIIEVNRKQRFGHNWNAKCFLERERNWVRNRNRERLDCREVASGNQLTSKGNNEPGNAEKILKISIIFEFCKYDS